MLSHNKVDVPRDGFEPKVSVARAKPIQRFYRPNVKTTVCQCWTGVPVFAEFDGLENFPLCPGLDHCQLPRLAQGVNLAAASDRARIVTVDSPTYPSSLVDLTGGGIKAGHDPAVAQKVEHVPLEQGRGNIGQ